MEEVLYCYDGSFDGFLCCVFESYASRERPSAIVREEDLEPTLFSTRQIVTDAGHARRYPRKSGSCPRRPPVFSAGDFSPACRTGKSACTA